MTGMNFDLKKENESLKISVTQFYQDDTCKTHISERIEYDFGI